MEKKKKQEYLFLAILFILNLVLVQCSTSTYDDGDSILHYLQSQSTFNNPSMLMNHWAKPIFVLLSSVFAYPGFWGMKLFNTLCVSGSAFLAWKIAKIQRLKYAWIIGIIALFSPHIFMVQSSGLTEPLFAFILVLSVYLYLKEKEAGSLIIFSFLPFVRSEGWVLGLVVIAMLIWQRKWKHLPLLLAGTALYGLIGLWYYDDLLWMFHQNPYKGVESKYGSGDFFHFFKQLPYLFGWPNAILFLIGLLALLQRTIKEKFKLQAYDFWVPGIFLALLISHSIFWYKGWFHSFGMQRVILAGFPLFVLICYQGLLKLISLPRAAPVKKSVLGIFTILLLWFPFSKNKAGFEIPEDFSRTARQDAGIEAKNWFNQKYPENAPAISMAYYYMLEVLDIQLGDTSKYYNIDCPVETLPKGTVVFWDDYFAESDMGVSLDQFQTEKFTALQVIRKEKFGRTGTIHIFEKK